MRATAPLLLLSATAGCVPLHRSGTTPGHSDDEQWAEYERIQSEEPPSPYVVVRRAAYRAPTRCGQGPYRLGFEALGAPITEQTEIYACAPRSIAATFRISAEDGSLSHWEPRTFGYDPDNARCVASASELRAGTGAGDAAGQPAGPRDAVPGEPFPGAGPPPRVEPSRAEPTALIAVPTDGYEPCPPGTEHVFMTGEWKVLSADESPPLQAGARFTVDIWSSLPNDLEGVTFVVAQARLPEGTTLAQWHDYRARYAEWYARYEAHLDRWQPDRPTSTVDRTDPFGPPPAARVEAQPPRPSVHAEWIAGYWHHGDRGWLWIAGFWRVPEADLRAELTVRAPSMPPPPRVEVEAHRAKPTHEAVWTPGSWQWDGRAFVWVHGAWRVPPSGRHRWRVAGWRARGAGAVFVPGGWTLSVSAR